MTTTRLATAMRSASARVAVVSLGEVRVGYLSYYADGKSIFAFDDSYIDLGPHRPVLSQSFVVAGDEDATVRGRLQVTYTTRAALPAFFSNLLPEGGLRSLVSRQLGVSETDEFALLLALGNDLPGGVVVAPSDSAPDRLLAARPDVATTVASPRRAAIGFSLAGVQLKFSMLRAGERWTLVGRGALGDSIVKLPSPVHPQLPRTEYVSMRMAAAVGVDVPDIQLVRRQHLRGLPPLNLPADPYAYVIRRFDREGSARVHIEDFAQILGLRPHEKYGHTNYDTLGRLVGRLLVDTGAQAEQFVRRLAVNVLLGNCDAHVKNWSLIYRDRVRPTLAPAYDIVSTLAYGDDRTLALNMARVKDLYGVTTEVWRRLARRSDLDPAMVLATARDTADRAEALWPTLLEELRAPARMRQTLRAHVERLAKW